ncbi:hypothetical protein J4207_04330 [Candidatus Woesearchaeota archaeon]|nr:hypothetical protein [Candidatus Woesearchaeota archaeon]
MEKRKEVVRLISELITGLDTKQKQQILAQLLQTKEGIPISAFNSSLSGLEIVVRYAKDNDRRSFSEIAATLNRKLSTIYTTYTKSRKKFSQALDVSDNSVCIPITIFHDRRYAVLELIISFLKEQERLSFKEIAALLHKHYNTITTTYRRYKSKHG